MRAAASAKTARVTTVIGRAAAIAWLKVSSTFPTTRQPASVTANRVIRAAAASLRRDEPPGARGPGPGWRPRARRTKATKARPRRIGRDDRLEARRHDVDRVEGDPDDPAARDRRHRPEQQDAERGQEAAAARRLVDRGIARDRAAGRRGGARHRARSRRRARARGAAGCRRSPRAADRSSGIAQDGADAPANSRGMAWATLVPEVGAEDAGALLEQGAGEEPPGAGRRSGWRAARLDEERAAEALRLVELRDRALALRPVPGDVGAFLRLALLRLGAELVEPGLGGFELRLQLFDRLTQMSR